MGSPQRAVKAELPAMQWALPFRVVGPTGPASYKNPHDAEEPRTPNLRYDDLPTW
jgi:hypothetical protein